jgi:cytochrome c oxidase subunit 2
VFASWLAKERAPASVDSAAAYGEQLFVTGRCAICHTVRGTPAGGRIGPDLTHIAGRRTLAAGTLLRTTGNLASWISDAPGIKPGTVMPSSDFNGKDLNAVVAWLETLR